MPRKTKDPAWNVTIKADQANRVWRLAGIAALAGITVLVLALIITDTSRLSTTPRTGNTPALSTATPGPGIGATLLSEKDGMTLVYVPEGEFLMGSTDAAADAQPGEKPQHTVYLDAFWIDRTEVTQGMYAQCVAAGKCDPPGAFNGGDNFPVKDVNWHAATAYCAWAGRRLPTEAEWEKAARGTDGRVYPWGNQAPGLERGNLVAHEGFTTEVGRFPAGASPYGAWDMSGNVWEWTADWYGETYYTSSPDRNPAGPTSGMGRVMRGGFHSPAWEVLNGSSVRAAFRESNLPDERIDSYGFRCVRQTGEESIDKSNQ